MNINEFNDDYPNELLDKLSKENKTILLLGDFNINLLNHDIHPPIIIKNMLRALFSIKINLPIPDLFCDHSMP